MEAHMVATQRVFFWILLGALIGVGLAYLLLFSFPTPSHLLTPPFAETPSNPLPEKRQGYEPTDTLKTYLAEERLSLKEKISTLEQRLAELEEEKRLLALKPLPSADPYLKARKKEHSEASPQTFDTIPHLQSSESMPQMGDDENLPEALMSPLLQNIKTEFYALQRHEAALSTRLGDRHPKLIEVRSEISTLKTQMDHEIRQLLLAASNEQDAASAKEDNLKRAIARENQEKRSTAVQALQSKIEILEKYYVALQKQDEELSAKERRLAAVTHNPPPIIEASPSSYSLKSLSTTLSFVLVMLTLGFLGGLGLSELGVLGGGCRVHRRVSSLEREEGSQMTPRTSLPILRPVSVWGRLKSFFGSHTVSYADVLTRLHSPKTHTQHAYQRAVFRLAETQCSMAAVKSPYLTVITSYKKGCREAACLALALAATVSKRKKKTLLVDLTSYSRSLSDFFRMGIEGHDPILLDQKKDLLRITVHDPETGIFFLPIGLANISTFTQEQVHRLLQGLKEVCTCFEVVLFNAGTLLEGDLARSIAQRAHEVLVVTDTKEKKPVTLSEIGEILGETAPPFSIIHTG